MIFIPFLSIRGSSSELD